MLANESIVCFIYHQKRWLMQKQFNREVLHHEKAAAILILQTFKNVFAEREGKSILLANFKFALLKCFTENKLNTLYTSLMVHAGVTLFLLVSYSNESRGD